MPFFDVEPNHIRFLELDKIEPGTISLNWVHIINDALGEPVRLPVLVAKGPHDGPVLGLTAAIHGNELNGIPVIHRIFQELDPTQLRGTIVGVLVVNVPGLLREQRTFNDGADLNRITPGRVDGNSSQVYIHRFIDRILSKFTMHIDLHTASFGRVNSYYIRADMSRPETSRMAKLQNAEIIVNNPPNDSTLRGAAAGLDIPSITVELRDPHLFQSDVVDSSLVGIHNVIYDLGMLEGEMLCPVKKTILCDSSYWMYTETGGILQVFPQVAEVLAKGQEVAKVSSVFGKTQITYTCPEPAVVIGKSVNPLNQTGSRIIHLGKNPREIPCILDDCEV